MAPGPGFPRSSPGHRILVLSVDKHAPAGSLTFETDIARGMADAAVVIIAVSTPRSDTGEANLVYVENVSEQIAKNLSGCTVIVEKSTVPVRTGERVKQVIERNNPGGHPFDVVSNPEFLREGHAITDTMKADRIVADAMSALDGADCLALVTEWDEFAAADLAEAKARMHFPLIADGRNLFEKREVEALGFTYRGVGV